MEKVSRRGFVGVVLTLLNELLDRHSLPITTTTQRPSSFDLQLFPSLSLLSLLHSAPYALWDPPIAPNSSLTPKLLQVTPYLSDPTLSTTN